MIHAKDHPDYITITCHGWKPILEEDYYKDIIIESLRHLSRENRVTIYAFVIMRNHLHMIWQMLGDNKRKDVQRDFLRFTAQQILMHLRYRKSSLMDELLKNVHDRKYQVWERNSLSVPLYSDKFLFQKFEYIHENPVRAGLVRHPADNRYSSAGFYYRSVQEFEFLVHYEG
jgi:putative transposase